MKNLDGVQRVIRKQPEADITIKNKFTAKNNVVNRLENTPLKNKKIFPWFILILASVIGSQSYEWFGFNILLALTIQVLSIFLGINAIKKIWTNYPIKKTSDNLDEKTKKNKYKKIFFIFILLLIIIPRLVVSILKNEASKINLDELKQNLKENTKTNKNDDVFEQVGNFYKNTEYHFRIKFPEGWEIKDGDGFNVVKKAVNGGSTVGIIITDFKNTPEFLEFKDGFIKETGMSLTDDIAEEVVSELNANDFSDKDFEEMMMGILEGIVSSPRESKLIEKKIGNMGGEKAFYTKTETTVKVLHIGENNIIGITYTTLHGGIFYHIFAGFPKEEASLMEKQILLSIASFVFEDY